MFTEASKVTVCGNQFHYKAENLCDIIFLTEENYLISRREGMRAKGPAKVAFNALDVLAKNLIRPLEISQAIERYEKYLLDKKIVGPLIFMRDITDEGQEYVLIGSSERLEKKEQEEDTVNSELETTFFSATSSSFIQGLEGVQSFFSTDDGKPINFNHLEVESDYGSDARSIIYEPGKSISLEDQENEIFRLYCEENGLLNKEGISTDVFLEKIKTIKPYENSGIISRYLQDIDADHGVERSDALKAFLKLKIAEFEALKMGYESLHPKIDPLVIEREEQIESGEGIDLKDAYASLYNFLSVKLKNKEFIHSLLSFYLSADPEIREKSVYCFDLNDDSRVAEILTRKRGQGNLNWVLLQRYPADYSEILRRFNILPQQRPAVGITMPETLRIPLTGGVQNSLTFLNPKPKIQYGSNLKEFKEVNALEIVGEHVRIYLEGEEQCQNISMSNLQALFSVTAWQK